MAEPSQSLRNHARIVPAYHYFIFGAFTINLFQSVMNLVGQLAFTLPFLWLSGGAAWAFPVAGMTLGELPFPEGAAVTMIVRGRQLIAPNGATRLEVGDHAYVLSRPEGIVMLQLLFGRPESS